MTDLNPDHYKFRRTSGLRAHDFRSTYSVWWRRRRMLRLLSAVAKIEVFTVFVIICAIVFLALRSA